MEFRILGPLEVRAAGRAVAVPGAKPRAVLAVLLLNANRSVSAEQLALALWGEEAPAGATNTVQVHVSRLRKALGAGEHLVTTATGYRLQLEPGALDAERFERALAAGREAVAAGRDDAAETLEEALALWRGRALDDLAYEPFAQGEIARLEEARMAAYELLFEAKLALGRHAEVVGQLEPLLAAHPYREGLRAQLMLALYRCDRQADALQAYQDARERLVEDLGIEPGARLRDLEAAILAHDPALAATAVEPAHVAPVEEPPPAARRLVAVVVARSAGHADAESMHAVLDARAAIIERHGGSVEGLIGDALVGVFGKTEVHEDDALRAVRAAVELRDEGGLTLGVEAGEAYVGATFATGEAFTVAAALRAPAGEIVLGEAAYRLVRDVVRVEPLDGAWRIVGVDAGDEPPRSPFVNRQRELDTLHAEFARVREERACRAMTVVGPAGMGKSRLARELAVDATIVVGRCPSYGEGLTYRPLAEIVSALAPGDPSTWARDLLDQTAAQTLLGAIGLAAAPAQPEETFWAVRRLFERVAERRPLVVIFDDVHWAQPALLELLDYLLAFVSDHPLLLLCLTRPDLGEARLAPRPDRSVLVLDPLGGDEARTLVGDAVSDDTAARIVDTAEGNPLFLEQLVAIGDETELPTTIQAVLAARLARLDPGERALLEEASVQGRSFYVGALGEAPASRLVSLVQRQLIRPERSDLPGEDAFRFAHALMREAAYRALPKQRRADLHEHVARWTEAWPGAQDETVGHHLAEAYRYRGELGDTQHELAGQAAERLADAADAALLRGDPDAGARLLQRAAALLDWYPAARGEVLPALAAALFEAGRTPDATRVAEEAIAAAPEPRLRVRAQVERELIRLGADTGAGSEPARRVLESGLDALADDEYGRLRLAYLRGRVAWEAGRTAAAEDAWAEAAELARRAGAGRELFELVGWRAVAAAMGPTPVAEAIGQCEAWRELVRGSPLATASTLNPLALLHALKGDLESAERLLGEANEILSALGGITAGVSHLEAWTCIAAGWPERAEPALRAHAHSTDDRSARATTAALLAHVILAQGRAEEAGELCRRAEHDAAAEDLDTHVLWRRTLARIRAAEGRCEEAETVAREAVSLAESTDLLWHTGAAMLDLAAVLRSCGREDEAEQASHAGLAVYERKGIVLSDPQGGT